MSNETLGELGKEVGLAKGLPVTSTLKDAVMLKMEEKGAWATILPEFLALTSKFVVGEVATPP